MSEFLHQLFKEGNCSSPTVDVIYALTFLETGWIFLSPWW